MKAYLQRMGRSLQLPVAVLPAAALLVGIGNWWASYSNDIVAHFLQAGGNAVLGQLPLLFAGWVSTRDVSGQIRCCCLGRFGCI